MSEYYSKENARDSQLYVNEKIVKDLGYFVKSDNGNLYIYNYHLTDFNRLIISYELSPSGFFSTSSYHAQAYDLNSVTTQEISVCFKTDGSFFFSENWYETSFKAKIDDMPYMVKLFSKEESTIYNELVAHIKRYGKQESESNKPKSRVAELRELYEDGILTKEELLNLLEK